MCYICHCFSWILDMLQRILTFLLACCLSAAICCGLIVAITAGVAYGYNYSLAEFLTLTRADVSVYMRRGQFYDDPDITYSEKIMRRRGDDDEFSTNITADYQDHRTLNADVKPLSDTWVKMQDTRKYAEKLTKYNSVQNVNKNQPFQNIPKESMPILTMQPPSIPSSALPSTAKWPTGFSHIPLRTFTPVDEMDLSDIKTNEKGDMYYKEEEEKPLRTNRRKLKIKTVSVSPDIKIRVQDGSLSNMKASRHWEVTVPPTVEYASEEVDEDNIVYKPV